MEVPEELFAESLVMLRESGDPRAAHLEAMLGKVCVSRSHPILEREISRTSVVTWLEKFRMSGISPRQSTKVKWYLAPPFYDLLLAVLHTSRPFPRTSTHRIFLFTPSYGVLQKQGTLDERGAPSNLHQRSSSRHSLTSSKRTSACVVVLIATMLLLWNTSSLPW